MVTPGYIPPHPAPSKPRVALPPLACDAHCHVFGPADRFPYSPRSSYIPPDAPKEALAALHRHLGFERAVIVQASCHGTDNRAMVDALEASGGTCRGIAIVNDAITAEELAALDRTGVRGVRFNFVRRLKAAQPLDERRAIMRMMEPLGWHVVVYFEPEDLPGIEDFLREIPMPVVIDHMGRTPVSTGPDGPEFARLARLMEDERFWVKVSGAERLSQAGPPYNDTDPIARRLIALAPDRVLFGTDWPHPNMETHAPDDGVLVDRIAAICSTEAERHKLLVANPARLYWPDVA